ncbi:uncharacterized protein LOC143430028 [Xylocopa sonorina]|uniref:uncharacterized protein LOC143430028 n=1 Tax=Xylocopa sonorina TaxID=1818115 RepID=UPI00403AFF82
MFDTCFKCTKRRLTDMRFTLLLLCALISTGSTLRLLRLDVPRIADPRWDKVTLRCEYDLEGEALYSVIWYKDGMEFFRFTPESKPPCRDFPIDGVYVDLNNSDSKQVTLLGRAGNRRGNVNLMGSYLCEVSLEGPSFATVFAEANMIVAVPSKEEPKLQGLQPSYDVGNVLRIECTSSPSYPPAQLIFIFNGNEVHNSLIKQLLTTVTSEDDIVTSTRIGLTLRLEEYHFPDGILNVTCRSTLPGIVGFKPLETTRTATLGISNQPLAQEQPTSEATMEAPTLWIIIYCLLMVFGVVAVT